MACPQSPEPSPRVFTPVAPVRHPPPILHHDTCTAMPPCPTKLRQPAMVAAPRPHYTNKKTPTIKVPTFQQPLRELHHHRGGRQRAQRALTHRQRGDFLQLGAPQLAGRRLLCQTAAGRGGVFLAWRQTQRQQPAYGCMPLHRPSIHSAHPLTTTHPQSHHPSGYMHCNFQNLLSIYRARTCA